MTSPQFNHGAHEMLDVHEVLCMSVSTLNKYTMLRPMVKDSELLDILNRQHTFIQQEYNTTLDCFKSGKDPAVPTKSYKMKQDNNFQYGIESKDPTAPIEADTEINDQIISTFMLGALKSAATFKTTAALEATNPVVRRVLADSLPNCIEMAYEISIYQNKHGYYQVPQLAEADMQMIQQAYSPARQAVTV
ncbi:spore coat protein [Domibacillus robiginosus]|uniref:spore coat protein n=1 Tax=Domibacillus robiginosus TaxID=1071054 RepID=UPI00067C503F|nr:spore coat protein [Domibacillus robiginosus]